MSLTMGNGPFGHVPAGRFNTELDSEGLIYLEPSPRWIRGTFAGELVVDSRAVRVLHEARQLARYYFPRGDVRMDLLERSDHTTSSPPKGDAEYWHLRVGDRVVENAAWSYPDPPEGASGLAGLIAFYWRAMDEWREEDEVALSHARDPYHRVDVVRTSRHVRVSIDGAVVAESRRALVLYEAGLPPRWYLPAEDVSAPLRESDLTTTCADKGHAEYRSVELGDEVRENIAWLYREPLHDAAGVVDRLAFFNEQVDIEVDGELQERPGGPWAHPRWWDIEVEFVRSL